MLTRLKVSGFKNLVDVDVHFGPFTCIAGRNGVGKSNLFDALRFLSATASQMTLVEAALSIRDEDKRAGNVRAIFHRVGNQTTTDEISFEAEMILPNAGKDYLGQETKPTHTWVRYALRLKYRQPAAIGGDAGTLEVVSEELAPIPKSDWESKIKFAHSEEWSDSVLIARSRKNPFFIATEEVSGQRAVRLYQDNRQGRAFNAPTATLPRTMLSTVQTSEYPTAVLARREIESWGVLQLETSALRRADSFDAPDRLSSNGSHLPATLQRLAKRAAERNGNPVERDAAIAAIFAGVSNRLAQLLDDVRTVSVDRDEGRQLLTLLVSGNERTPFPANALSDGTLRFLALAVMEMDRESGGLLCLEEPENGIHPQRIRPMMKLLQDFAVDTSMACNEENPLRQVLINTHSPLVVFQTPEDSLLMAELIPDVKTITTGNTSQDVRFRKLAFSCLSGTWREQLEGEQRITTKGGLLSYLNSIGPARSPRPSAKRVMDRSDLQQLLPFLADQ